MCPSYVSRDRRVHFGHQGGLVKSLLSLLSYLGSGKYRDHYLCVPIPPTNTQDDRPETVQQFVSGLSDALKAADSRSDGPSHLHSIDANA